MYFTIYNDYRYVFIHEEGRNRTYEWEQANR